jgi:hypothetical protein
MVFSRLQLTFILKNYFASKSLFSARGAFITRVMTRIFQMTPNRMVKKMEKGQAFVREKFSVRAKITEITAVPV